MKKFFKIFLSAILLCPTLLFFACTSPDQYQIKAYTSDSTLGSVPQAIETNFKKKDEGTNITLTAKENYSATNPFICWVKDHKEVVSNNKTLNLTYNSKTEGEYTAVFHETKLSSMSYASLSSVKFTANSDEYSTVKYTISCLGDSFMEYTQFANGTLTIDEDNPTNNYSIIYFGDSEGTKEFRLKFNLELIEASGSVTTVSADYNGVVTRNDFDSEGNCVVSQNISGLLSNLGVFEITFSKLTKNTFEI